MCLEFVFWSVICYRSVAKAITLTAYLLNSFSYQKNRQGVLVLWCSAMVPRYSGYTNAVLHSIKLKLRFCTGSNPASGMSEICNSEDL